MVDRDSRFSQDDDSLDDRVNLVNAAGGVGGYVTFLRDGRAKIVTSQDHDFISLLMSQAVVLAGALTTSQRVAFAGWAELSENAWTPRHKEVFGVAFLHFLYSQQRTRNNIPQALIGVVDQLPASELPPIKKSITPDISELFYSLYTA